MAATTSVRTTDESKKHLREKAARDLKGKPGVRGWGATTNR